MKELLNAFQRARWGERYKDVLKFSKPNFTTTNTCPKLEDITLMELTVQYGHEGFVPGDFTIGLKLFI